MDDIQRWRSSVGKTWLLGAMLLVGSFTASVNATTPENYHQVSPELYRSSQPSAAQMQTLEQQGIKTVLSLRQWHDRQRSQRHRPASAPGGDQCRRN
ncbi:dual specificity protein phosphatase family protein [Serratia sp. 3ACOL1]|uniref:dual specificity protein phosphatase family protein n=1 Tax=Serratia sp. 3ACOL1 TaxID=2448483 RepID=UPI0013905B89|nr:dual specificity protein phosphatase family protein [Serratia sp. 3ACOL1]